MDEPPHSREAEQSLLGALLLDNSAFDRVESLAPSAFYSEQHRILWATMRRMIEAAKPVDVVTVADELQRSGQLEKAGGAQYLALLAQNTPGAINIEHYAALVCDKATLRSIGQRAQEIADAVGAPAANPRAIAERAEALALSVLDDEADGDIDLARLLMKAAHDADEARKAGAPKRLRTGFRDLDTKLGGLGPGSVTIIAAGTSFGKTALALNIAEQVASRHAVAFFSLEMSRDEIARRLNASNAEVPLHLVGTEGLSEDQANALAESASALGASRNLLLDDRGAVSLGYVRASFGAGSASTA